MQELKKMGRYPIKLVHSGRGGGHPLLKDLPEVPDQVADHYLHLHLDNVQANTLPEEKWYNICPSNPLLSTCLLYSHSMNFLNHPTSHISKEKVRQRCQSHTKWLRLPWPHAKRLKGHFIMTKVTLAPYQTERPLIMAKGRVKKKGKLSTFGG